MSTTLYPGIAFSPQAELTGTIGAADTIIPVSDVSAFPDAPNLATIGTDEEGETVLYTAKTANALSGCRRGVEGAAKSWQAGEPIGRNFTAKDHGDLIAEVQEAAKTAEAGGVTFDDGETFQQKYDSGELVGPIGPTGKTGSTGATGPQGPTGKTAYQYAVEGGYTGTEAQFKTLMGTGPWLPMSGGTLTGRLWVPNPTVAGEAANKRYVDNQIESIAIPTIPIFRQLTVTPEKVVLPSDLPAFPNPKSIILTLWGSTSPIAIVVPDNQSLSTIKEHNISLKSYRTTSVWGSSNDDKKCEVSFEFSGDTAPSTNVYFNLIMWGA